MLLVGVLISCCSTRVLCQEGVSPQAAAVQPSRAQLEAQITLLKRYIGKLEQARETSGPVDPAVLQAYVRAQVRAYDFAIEKMDINASAYHAQSIASYIVLALVVLVVSAGVVFSAFQLWKGMTIGVQTSTDMEISAGKVRVTSSVVGIVVLTISIVFLFIYTQQIYHIHPVIPPPAQGAPKT